MPSTLQAPKASKEASSKDSLIERMKSKFTHKSSTTEEQRASKLRPIVQFGGANCAAQPPLSSLPPSSSSALPVVGFVVVSPYIHNVYNNNADSMIRCPTASPTTPYLRNSTPLRQLSYYNDRQREACTPLEVINDSMPRQIRASSAHEALVRNAHRSNSAHALAPYSIVDLNPKNHCTSSNVTQVLPNMMQNDALRPRKRVSSFSEKYENDTNLISPLAQAARLDGSNSRSQGALNRIREPLPIITNSVRPIVTNCKSAGYAAYLPSSSRYDNNTTGNNGNFSSIYVRGHSTHNLSQLSNSYHFDASREQEKQQERNRQTNVDQLYSVPCNRRERISSVNPDNLECLTVPSSPFELNPPVRFASSSTLAVSSTNDGRNRRESSVLSIPIRIESKQNSTQQKFLEAQQEQLNKLREQQTYLGLASATNLSASAVEESKRRQNAYVHSSQNGAPHFNGNTLESKASSYFSTAQNNEKAVIDFSKINGKSTPPQYSAPIRYRNVVEDRIANLNSSNNYRNSLTKSVNNSSNCCDTPMVNKDAYSTLRNSFDVPSNSRLNNSFHQQPPPNQRPPPNPHLQPDPQLQAKPNQPPLPSHQAHLNQRPEPQAQSNYQVQFKQQTQSSTNQHAQSQNCFSSSQQYLPHACSSVTSPTTILDFDNQTTSTSAHCAPKSAANEQNDSETKIEEIFIFNANSNFTNRNERVKNVEESLASSASELDSINNDSAESMKSKSSNKFNFCGAISRNSKKSPTPVDLNLNETPEIVRPNRLSRITDSNNNSAINNNHSNSNKQHKTLSGMNPIVITPLSPISPLSQFSSALANESSRPNDDSYSNNNNISDDRSVVLYNSDGRTTAPFDFAQNSLFNASFPTVLTTTTPTSAESPSADTIKHRMAHRRRSGGVEAFCNSPATNAVLRSPSMQDTAVLLNKSGTCYGNSNQNVGAQLAPTRYYDASTTAAQIVEAVRRSANIHQHELTEPIVALAKQLASKEMELERLKAKLNRRSDRAENRCAHYEEELAMSRHEVEYMREQMNKLRQKLRQCETECAALKEKKEEAEAKLKNATASHELKIQAMEQENSIQRKEYHRLKDVEEAYEKYLDERDWGEKVTDSLNAKLDESERVSQAREREIADLKAKVEQLTDTLGTLRNNTLQSAPSSHAESEAYRNKIANLQDELNELKTPRQNSRKTLKLLKSAEKDSAIPEGRTLNSFRKHHSISRSSNEDASHLKNENAALARSASSTPDSASLTGAPTSSSGISSSGMSAICINGDTQRLKQSLQNDDGALHSSTSAQKSPFSNSGAAIWRQCRQKLAFCQRRVLSLMDVTQRVLNGGRPSTADIMGGVTSDSEMEEELEDDSIEAHSSDITKLQHCLDELHTSLLSAYARNRALVEMQRGGAGASACRLQ